MTGQCMIAGVNALLYMVNWLKACPWEEWIKTSIYKVMEIIAKN